MSTAQFNHWNRKFHCHGIDLCDTRKREILSKIKSRVLDEFIPIKTIIEEKLIIPLPSQIGELFSSEEQLKVVLHYDLVFADGTFNVALKLFEQLYVIHKFQNGEGRLVFLLWRLYISVYM